MNAKPGPEVEKQPVHNKEYQNIWLTERFCMPTWLCHVGNVCVLLICHKPEGGKNGEASDKTGAAVQKTQVHTVPERKEQKIQKLFTCSEKLPVANREDAFLHNLPRNILPKMDIKKGEALTLGSRFPFHHLKIILPNDATHKYPLIWPETCIFNFILRVFRWPHFGFHLLWVHFHFSLASTVEISLLSWTGRDNLLVTVVVVLIVAAQCSQAADADGVGVKYLRACIHPDLQHKGTKNVLSMCSDSTLDPFFKLLNVVRTFYATQLAWTEQWSSVWAFSEPGCIQVMTFGVTITKVEASALWFQQRQGCVEWIKPLKKNVLVCLF